MNPLGDHIEKQYFVDENLSLVVSVDIDEWHFFRSTSDHHHHHHVVPLAWISVTLSRHFSLSFIASGRSSGLHPVSSHSC